MANIWRRISYLSAVVLAISQFLFKKQNALGTRFSVEHEGSVEDLKYSRVPSERTALTVHLEGIFFIFQKMGERTFSRNPSSLVVIRSFNENRRPGSSNQCTFVLGSGLGIGIQKVKDTQQNLFSPDCLIIDPNVVARIQPMP